jgi:serine/threonine protein kinase
MNKGVSYKIGRFQIIRRIGKGAQGTVSPAKDPYPQCLVAIRVLHFRSEDEKARRKALLLVAGTMGKLKYTDIISRFEAEDSKGIP